MKRWLLLMGILIGLSLQIKAQWEIGVKNQLSPQANTQLFLKYSASSRTEKSFLVEIRFRPKGEMRDFLKKEKTLKTNRTQMFSLPFLLPEGEYEVSVDIRDNILNTVETLAPEDYYQVNPQRDIFTSDIFLSYSNDPENAFKEPLLTPILLPEKKKVFYFMEIYAPGYEVLTIRAVLFRETAGEVKQGTAAYSSIQQTKRVSYIYEEGKTVFEDTLSLDGLEAGEYLIDVRVYDDDVRLNNEVTRVILGGDIKNRIFADLDASIRMMEYTAPLETLEKLLFTPDSTVKKTEFLRAWEKLYNKESENRMEAYYKKVYEANNRFEEDQLGWQTDRGRIFIQYGEPARMEEVTIRGDAYQRWLYPKWSLSFLFEKRNQRYTLVE